MSRASMTYGFTPSELRQLHRLSTPAKIQDFLDTLPFHAQRRETCWSPRIVLRERKAQCIEGALLAAAALRLQGRRPLILDLEAELPDQDHVVAVFKEKTGWGAISKTNHAVLRYRDPVYRTIRELVMSYFHEYTDARGRKTLRRYSKPVDLSRFDREEWMTDDQDLWYIVNDLLELPHQRILSKKDGKRLRPQGKFEREVGERVEWKKSRA